MMNRDDDPRYARAFEQHRRLIDVIEEIQVAWKDSNEGPMITAVTQNILNTMTAFLDRGEDRIHPVLMEVFAEHIVDITGTLGQLRSLTELRGR